MSNLVIDNCNIFHSTIFLQSNKFQLKEMFQMLKAQDFQPVYSWMQDFEIKIYNFCI